MTKTKLSGHKFGQNRNGVHHMAVRPWLGLGQTGLVIEVWESETKFGSVFLSGLESNDLVQAIVEMQSDIKRIDDAMHEAITRVGEH